MIGRKKKAEQKETAAVDRSFLAGKVEGLQIAMETLEKLDDTARRAVKVRYREALAELEANG